MFATMKKMASVALTGAALAFGSMTPALAAFDTSAAITEIDTAVTTVGAVGGAVILVGVAIYGFRVVRKMIGV